jgi:localization factor PodJL
MPVGSLPTGSIPTAAGVATMSPLAFASLHEAAARGDRLAQYDLASRYAEGRGVPRDLTLAAQWFEKSADQALAPAQYRLGVIYEKGLGVPLDTAAAVKWYSRAAAAGHVRAMHNLAVLTAQAGIGGKPDYATAADWFRKAAEFGVRDSQYNLAILYARGLGVERNLKQSYVWFAIAAAQGDEDAGKKRDEVGDRLEPAQLAAAKALAAAFRPREEAALANDVSLPAGGWSTAASKDGKPPHKARLGV